MNDSTRLLLVVLGGGVGSGARYLVSVGIAERLGGGFPWPTLAVNVVGSMLLGAVMALSALGDDARVVLSVGLMGGFTTYSSFNHETLRYLHQGDWRAALLNAGVMFAACMLAGWVGMTVARVAS